MNKVLMSTWLRSDKAMLEGLEFIFQLYNAGAQEFEIEYKFQNTDNFLTIKITDDLKTLFSKVPFISAINAFKYRERQYGLSKNFLRAYEEALSLKNKNKKDIRIKYSSDMIEYDNNQFTIEWWRENFHLTHLSGEWIVSYFD